MINRVKYENASGAFHHLFNKILREGTKFDNTIALFNVGFQLDKPMENNINDSIRLKRNWKRDYAIAEWNWYLSGDPNISKLGEIYGKVPEIWKRMADKNGNVNSNYGAQWKRDNQINKVIKMLKDFPETRKASVSIYDGKEIGYYKHDTPCTYAVNFTILNNKLDMSVVMRSNDLWFGFCNDQYCFSRLQEHVAKKIDIEIGTYFHFAQNLHLYNNIFEKVING